MDLVDLLPSPAAVMDAKPAKSAGEDFLRILNEAADQVCSEGADRGPTLILDLDPGLRALRVFDKAAVRKAVKTLIELVVGLAGADAALSVKAEGRDSRLAVLISARVNPNHDLGGCRHVGEAARLAGGLLETLPHPSGIVSWRLVLDAPMAAPSVLVIDDDRLARLALVETLRCAGFASEGVNGLDGQMRLLAGGRQDVVLIDLWLDDTDALDLARLSTSPTFALNDNKAQLSRWALTTAGFQGVLMKPLNVGKLKSALGMKVAAQIR